MTREEVFEKMNEVFRDVFDDEALMISEETTSEDIEDWDSFAQMNLIVAMEKQFGLKFNIKEINSLKNVGEMIMLIRSRIK